MATSGLNTPQGPVCMCVRVLLKCEGEACGGKKKDEKGKCFSNCSPPLPLPRIPLSLSSFLSLSSSTVHTLSLGTEHMWNHSFQTCK